MQKKVKNKNKRREDKSPVVPQDSKLKDGLDIRELKWTDKQKEFFRLALDKDTKLMFVAGPAGTSKTLTAVYCGLKLLSDKRVSDILYLRSAVESSDSKIGFLPGDANEKLAFYNLPFLDKLEELLTKTQVEKLTKEDRVKAYPINFARGMSWNAKYIIVDEAQNSSLKEIVTIMTRVGMFSKCIVLADPMQTDLPAGKNGGFERLKSLFCDTESQENGIQTFEFNEDDVVRSPLCRFIVKKLAAPNYA
jgi:phosphate starvation-inducible PhoH-like protein